MTLWPERIGRYEIRGRVGVGGFATVYRAYDPELDREVALKVLHPHLSNDADVRARFLREGRALARVRHPNIVQVHDAGQQDGLGFLAMELVEGQPLDQVLLHSGPMSVVAVLPIVEQVAGALDAVHAQGLIHRDVKPVNIIVEQGTGRAVLLDLGVVRAIDAVNTTGAGPVLGTPGFMAPEQLLTGAAITPQTDVYQFGATVYALFTGRPPFSGDPLQLFHAIVNLAPEPVQALRPDLPAEVAAVVMQALAKEPGARPAGTRAFAERLRGAATGGGLSEARTVITSFPSRPAERHTERVAVTPAAAPPAPPAPRLAARAGGNGWRWVVGGGVAAMAVLAGFAFALSRGGGDDVDSLAGTGFDTPAASASVFSGTQPAAAVTGAATPAVTRTATPARTATPEPSASPTPAPTATPPPTPPPATPTPATPTPATATPRPATPAPTASQAPVSDVSVPADTARGLLAGVMAQRGFTPDGEVMQIPATGRGRSLSAQRGICGGPGDGPCQMLFILLDERFLGTDTAAPSAVITGYAPVGTNQFTVTYANFARGDAACCPSLPPVTVLYTWDGNRLTPNRTPPGQ